MREAYHEWDEEGIAGGEEGVLENRRVWPMVVSALIPIPSLHESELSMVSGRFRGLIPQNETTRTDARTLVTHIGSTKVTATQ